MTSGLWEKWLLPGIWITIQLTLYSALFATVVAFGVGIARTSRLWIVRFLTGCYVEIFRGTSALVLMF
ncbi:ectoine/hydroxyectoine ABC transporter permease subunit EhuC, partial [Streptomyces sp. MCAF7]